MKIIRALCFFDTETTGTNPEKDRIVELSINKILLTGERVNRTWRINPEIPIPKEASDIHNITDEDVKDCPTFAEVATEIYEEFYESDLAGFNINDFDIPIMIAEFKRAKVNVAGIELAFLDWPSNFVDVYKIYKKLFPQTLSALFKHYTGTDLEGAHNANNDNVAAEVILSYILEQNFTQTTTPEQLDNFVQGDKKRYDLAGKLYIDAEGVVRWAFGPHINKAWDSDLGFTQWVLAKDFPADTKEKLKELLKG